MRTLAIAPLVLGLALALTGDAGWALMSRPSAPARAHVDVIEVSGLIDPVQVDFVTDALRAAERGGAEALVIQLDSGGGVVPAGTADVLAFRLSHAAVPVAVWVGPSSRALGTAFRLVQAASVVGVGPGARLGRAGRSGPGDGGAAASRTLGAAEALAGHVADVDAPTLGDLVVDLDGRVVGGRTLETAEVVAQGGQQRRRPTVAVRFAKLGLVPRLLHTAASPSVAYLLLAVGLALVVLELYSAGIGLAAATGAGCLVLACYGLAALPTRPAAVALVLVAAAGFAIDVQAGAPRTWTVLSTAALAGGSLALYRQGLAPSPLAVVVVVAGMVLFMVAGMPSMVRARFSTPTIGRDSLLGELGLALAPVDPEGAVEVRGAPWRARTNRATPIPAGQAVRVVAIDGLLLEVEPESGGARDYRRE